MRVLQNLEPRDVFYYFEEICKIPHSSGNTNQISNYLVDFAKKRNLEYYQDAIGNVIIIKEATPLYIEREPIILQGHMDMVAVKTDDCDLNLLTDGLLLQTEDDYVYANETSLGGDDGIAIAMGLAILDSKQYQHPRIELVCTVDEEVGMDGARALEVSAIKGKRLINIDSEEEGIFTTGCAGGARVKMTLSDTVQPIIGILCELQISGLQGGHSGIEIHLERGNAICILGRVLTRLLQKTQFHLYTLSGGVADNAIPTYAEARFLVTGYNNQNGNQLLGKEGFSIQECQTILKCNIDKLNNELLSELYQKDDSIRISFTVTNSINMEALSLSQTQKITNLLNSLPYGVIAMSRALPGIVETSLNPGILKLKDGILEIETSVRSNINSARVALVERLIGIANLANAKVTVSGEYPGWSYRVESPLRDKMVELYYQLYQEYPEIKTVHAGLECGLLTDKIPELDCVSIGPNMENIHTTKERLSISSTERVFHFLLKLLETI